MDLDLVPDHELIRHRAREPGPDLARRAELDRTNAFSYELLHQPLRC